MCVAVDLMFYIFSTGGERDREERMNQETCVHSSLFPSYYYSLYSSTELQIMTSSVR